MALRRKSALLTLLCYLTQAVVLRAAKVSARDGSHMHMNGGSPLTRLNETELELWHGSTPPSYFTVDMEEGSEHRGLMLLHALLMSFAFFFALPIVVALRGSRRSSMRRVAMGAFYVLSALGCATSSVYRKSTPNMYEGSVHAKHGYLLLAITIILPIIDSEAFFKRVLFIFRRHIAALLTSSRGSLRPEYVELMADEAEETDGNDFQDMNRHQRNSFSSSDTTIIFTEEHGKLPTSIMRHIGQILLSTFESSLPIAGLVQLTTGIVVYTGGCRGSWVNGCLAHLIKGGIFWCYGLITFSRFLGAFAEYGWAWNSSPSPARYVSAEFIESALIFVYGITNIWMERFGVPAGDPFTTKQIQHISIAGMFWFAGLVGMAIESRRLKSWLSSPVVRPSDASKLNEDGASEDTPMSSYTPSMNPFPAVVISITGAAMAAHAQRYLFQVQIHELWGNLLAAAGVMRCLTYAFLWVSSPKSTLPSRPPTEALSGFFMACGGLVFMLSNEEVTIAAMRNGYDDMMMFLNLSVAITSLALCWVTANVALGGWVRTTALRDPSSPASP